MGGDDIDRIISEYVITEAGKANNVDIHDAINSLPEKKKYAFQGEFKNEVESAKKVLSQSESATISIYDYLETEDGDPIDIEVSLTRANFENMIRPLIQRTLDLIDELLEKTAYPIDTIDNILLVGGSSCIPLVRKMLTDKYGQDKILASEKPMLAIAEGAAILSHSMGTESECPNCGKIIPVGADECPYCHMSTVDATPTNTKDGGVLVSFTTKHKYFIEIADDADNKDYELIIGDNEVLPNEVSKKFYTLVENQKIIAVKLYNDAENNTKQMTGIGFLSIQENLPVHSELQFTFRLTEDEVMSVRVKVAASGKTTDVVISRGKLDEHCLCSIQKSFDDVITDPTIDDDNKTKFVEKLQKTIDIISVDNMTAESTKWQEIESSVQTAKTKATTKEEGDSVFVIITKILLDNFGRFIREEDKSAMRRELTNYENACTPMSKNEIANELEELTDKYGLFVHAFLLNISGHDKSDPVRANKALVAFNQFMAALNEGNINKARDILDANENLIGKINLGPGIGGTTGIGRENG